MTDEGARLPKDFPDYLRHTDADTPVPTWAQVTRSRAAKNDLMIAHLSRLVADTTDAALAQAKWESWPGPYQRSVALLVDKIYHEGWLDYVGAIQGWPWDGGCFFQPRHRDHAALVARLDAKATGNNGAYIQGRLDAGWFAYLTHRHHRGWVKSWMESDVAMAALHLGMFDDGLMEAHFDVFNALYIKGAPRREVVRIPLLGAFNRAMFKLHRRYELKPQYAALARTSANFYHLMRGNVPLSF
ncbi:MAG: hypothetical protein HY231_11595 [Acidobacteria bacterium]|nr:hypothetical protein [Acidobacteriota bacterium]